MALLPPAGPEGGASADLGALMDRADRGDGAGAEALFIALYSELHLLAQRQLGRNAGAATLGTTTLLHEAYLDMSGRTQAVFPDRDRFMGYAARVMRGLIIDYVRKRRALKRGRKFALASLDRDVADPGVDSDELERMGQAIDALAAIDAELAQIVDLKFFCGFSFTEIASMRGLSERTVQRHWRKARVYLHRALGDASALS